MPILEVFGPDCDTPIAIEAKPGQKLSTAIWLSGAFLPAHLCGGLALCGNCRCRFLNSPPEPTTADKEYFPPDKLNAGWRLACRHTVPARGKTRLQLPPRSHRTATAIHTSPKPDRSAWLGIDFGTTTIQWRAKECSGECQALGSMANPQGAVGADVITRLQFALEPEGGKMLSAAGLNAISRILAEVRQAGLLAKKICVAANSAMTEILLNKDISGLAFAPYQLSFAGNEWIDIELPNLDKPARIYFPPLPAPFAGGDIAAGVAFLLDRPKPFLLADLGTNAELALLDSENRLFLASAPLGPAMEGVGPRSGQPAGENIAAKYSMAPDGLKAFDLNGQPLSAPDGISATGYISLLSLLLKFGLLSQEGQLLPTPAMPLARQIAANIHEGALDLAPLSLHNSDSELLLKVKAALRSAADILLEKAGIGVSALKAVYLAGALGENASIDDLATLGFLSNGMAAKALPVGNASLEGACLFASDPARAGTIVNLCENAQVLQLADDKKFAEQFINEMRWGQ